MLDPSDPRLCQCAAEVPAHEIASVEIQGLIDEMFQIAKGERADLSKKIMVGLAAPQIGVMKQVILVDMGIEGSRRQLGQLRAFINPKVMWRSEEKAMHHEGCYSVEGHIRAVVPRSNKIKVKAYNREGQIIEEEIEGFAARIFQHEVDHLEGVRFPDRVGPDGFLQWVEEDQYPQYREKWHCWEHRCPWETWLAVKNGSFKIH